MANLTRWDPFSDFRTTMDRFFDDGFVRPRGGFVRPWRLATTEYAGFPVEVSETDSAIDVKAALPGLKPEDVEITVADDVLTIRGEYRDELEKGDEKRGYHRREIRYGSFRRAFSLPVSVDADRAEARYDNGVLTLSLPKSEALKPKQIKVGVGGTKVVEGETTGE